MRMKQAASQGLKSKTNKIPAGSTQHASTPFCQPHSSTLKVETCSHKMSVDFQQNTHRYIHVHYLRCRNLKSYIITFNIVTVWREVSALRKFISILKKSEHQLDRTLWSATEQLCSSHSGIFTKASQFSSVTLTPIRKQYLVKSRKKLRYT